MKILLLIAVFCVVPCAFQDVWDEYDTWYDELNGPDDGSLAVNVDQPKDDQAEGPKPVENDENKFHASDYGDDNYRDYEIEDNRDDIKNVEHYQAAVRDFEDFQKMMYDDKQSEELDENISAVDEESQMNLDVLLPEEAIPESDSIPDIEFDKNQNYESKEIPKAVEKNEDNDEKDVQLDIEGIRDETQQLLGAIDNVFDEDAGNGAKDVLPEAHDQTKLEDIVDETRQILEDINTNFDEHEENNDEEQNAELPVADVEDNIQNIKDETQQILEKTNVDFDKNKNVEDEQPISEVEAEIKDTIDETRQILEETDSEFVESKNKEEDQQNIEDDVNDEAELHEIADGEDTVDKVYEDLNEDLDKLFETWQKLSVDNNDEVYDNSDNADNDKAEQNADDDLNRDYADIGDDDINDADIPDAVIPDAVIPDFVIPDANINDADIGDDAKDKIDFDYEGEARILASRDDYYESIVDKDLSDLFKDFENANDGDEKKDSYEPVYEPSSYGNDALAAESSEKNDTEVKGWVAYEEKNEDDTKNASSEKSKDEPVKVSHEEAFKPLKETKDVDELTSSELDELSRQFVMLHDSEIKMARDDTPIHITLTADEPVIITSPNYPNSYPTDQSVVDWILEGLGTGIEVNVTDLALNSAQGHFLMIKPGQSDASGDSGIVFAYKLNSERRYRFRDVNQVFIRFNPLGGMAFSKGFQLSAKMIEPPGGIIEEEDVPEPEFLIPEPQHTASLLLAGVNATGFLDLQDEFQRLLADMATMYINANDIDPGLNSTRFSRVTLDHPVTTVGVTRLKSLEKKRNVVTQITRSYVCNMNWPGFDSCVEVTFGVPLVYEDEDVPSRLNETELMDMWNTYASRDPFAARLSSMGISDFSVPQESRILMMWVVLGVGAVIGAALLAFALWRYSCIENYTRMQDYSDTDSIHDKKRGLDMYPTPHQTLPPLYNENDYKWADRSFHDDSTRVDLGGFTNNTFTRDELSSESEDDVIVSRDRNSFKPRDFNVV